VDERPSISVIIPARNVGSTLADQLRALSRQRVPVPWEIVVADNGSTDDTPSVAASFARDLPLTVVDASGRLGANHARNRGVAAARGELLCFCDGDDLVHDGWLAAYHASRDDWDLAGGAVDLCTLNSHEVQSWSGRWNIDGRPSIGGWLTTINGCNFAVHREVHARVGGFDERYLAGGDDLEFGYRAQLAGHRLGYVPDAAVAYRLRPTLRATARQRYHLGRCRARLYRQYRAYGLRRRSWRFAVRQWQRLGGQVPRLVRATPTARGQWVVDAAFLAGLIVGSLRAGTVYVAE
jgi:glycosyltransferase involved in cell wall biosynthesis